MLSMTFGVLFFLTPPLDIHLILPADDEVIFTENHLGLGFKPGEENLTGGAPGSALSLSFCGLSTNLIDN